MSDDMTQPTSDAQPARPALDPKNPVTRAMLALQKVLNDTANAACAESDATYTKLIESMSPMIATPGVREAIAGFETQRDAARSTARDTAAQRIRAEHADIFAAFDVYGRPPAPMPTAANNRAARNATKTDDVIRDASGLAYVKSPISIVTNGTRTYVRTNAAPCGACPISETIGKTFSAAGNLRQDAYRAIGRSTPAQMLDTPASVDADGNATPASPHAACWSAYRDAESDHEKVVTVTRFVPAAPVA